MAVTCNIFTLLSIMVMFSSMKNVKGNPAIVEVATRRSPDATGYDPMEICIENCAQCKKMLGAWFEGPLCAKSCIKFKGKQIPECEDFASISPFLNKL